ncbi:MULTISPECIES: helix-turn-helix domain-containing protein [Bacillus subtilis group]|uniref:helix-turn-helix domain-containing protein n=1 Tax=Bacillus subtilis group TaxID=653685 RepID=UPI0011BE45B3|nr:MULTISPECIES: helix-turn-helix transcriptional regulator [Bacillus subtilis group]MCY8796295.1 helix-turn-helix transcriptional regulator [Bacillus inaquosorum]MEC0771997.1 helix-turn-helix transcriptional regulator [Bacillus inaquosorum]MEC0797366.1 helix-turn-helix transcriptional regulator [Bacillus inaquosorum]MEC1684745.1 helix-turn-helix transcriptional regulator [Bacillus mojavensis]MEC1706414.1 helix-turn-helix transcriptional regulator [Bacillus mojavensis]
MKKMKVSTMLEGSHSLMNDVVIGTAKILEDAEIVLKIDDLLKERGITQQDLAMMTGMRIGTVSQIVNGKGISFNKVQLLAIMVALQVTNLSDLIEIRLPQDLKERYEQNSESWVKTREMPFELKELYRDNMVKATVNKLK